MVLMYREGDVDDACLRNVTKQRFDGTIADGSVSPYSYGRGRAMFTLVTQKQLDNSVCGHDRSAHLYALITIHIDRDSIRDSVVILMAPCDR